MCGAMNRISKPLVLPRMNASGMVRNVRAAMSLAGTQADELEAAVAAFSAATTRDMSRFYATQSFAWLQAMNASNDVHFEHAA